MEAGNDPLDHKGKDQAGHVIYDPLWGQAINRDRPMIH